MEIKTAFRFTFFFLMALLHFHTSLCNGKSLSFTMKQYINILPNGTITDEQQEFSLMIQKDEKRIKAFAKRIESKAVSGGAINPHIPTGAVQIITIGIGTSAQPVPVHIDTASDLLWIECQPCVECQSEPRYIYDPTKSTSYYHVGCESPDCSTTLFTCSKDKSKCLFGFSYLDSTYVRGELGKEILVFNDGTKLNSPLIGCAHQTNDSITNQTAGVLGLGQGGSSSLALYMSKTYGYHVFSYCFLHPQGSIDHKKTPSLLIFEDKYPSSNSVIYTKIDQNPIYRSPYFVNLLGISIGGQRIAGIDESVFQLKADGSGGVVLDSGTAVSWLTTAAYKPFVAAFRSMAADLRWKPYDKSGFENCYDFTDYPSEGVTTMRKIVFHFEGGADVELDHQNCMHETYQRWDPYVYCLAFRESHDFGTSFLGSTFQMGYRVVYDLANAKIGFDKMGCIRNV